LPRGLGCETLFCRDAAGKLSTTGNIVTRLILVCGPFGSGTTAVAGLLAGLGLPGCEPYFHSNDAQTPNTFESIAFRSTLLRIVSEAKLSLIPGVEPGAEIARFHAGIASLGQPTIFLKHALSAFLIPNLCRQFDTRLVYVLRPLAEIEATRQRRNWPAATGGAGAKVIYGRMFGTLIDHAFPTMILRYSQVLADPLDAATRLAQFAGLDVAADKVKQAAGFIRRDAARPE
jgi:hypothetical protein